MVLAKSFVVCSVSCVDVVVLASQSTLQLAAEVAVTAATSMEMSKTTFQWAAVLAEVALAFPRFWPSCPVLFSVFFLASVNFEPLGFGFVSLCPVHSAW